MKRTSRLRAPSTRRLFRRVFSVCLPLSLLALVCSFAPAARADDSTDRHAEARQQFVRAESLRATVEAKPDGARALKDYTDLVSAYRRVYLITPRAAEVPAAIKQVAELYNDMGGRFDRKYFTSAVETYEFLLHEYPTNRFREEALLAIATIQRNHLAQSNLARQGYQDFLKKFPGSSHAGEARQALAEMDAEERLSTDATIPGIAPSAPPQASDDEAAQSANVGPIHVWNADTYTRIVIDLGGQAKYQAARVSDPDRIYFDIDNAKLKRELLRQSIDVPTGGYLKAVRVAQNRADTVRVVLDVAQVKDYSVFELANPDRLVVDVYGPNASAQSVRATPDGPIATKNAKTIIGPLRAPLAPAGQTATARLVASAAPPVIAEAASAVLLPVKKTAAPAVPPRASAAAAAAGKTTAAARTAPSSAASSSSASTGETANASPAVLLPVKKTADSSGPPQVPGPLRNGETSLTRALGLKVNRIVIDAGHGGHDTGTIGPSGLMEKDLALDVARRLGRIIQDRLPSAEVIYTRDDDSFVGLEQRTQIANDAKADLFLSIHANSSDDHTVSGVESYYLNFSASPGAMEVAARENALSQGGVHDLPDLVKKIANNEKIDESRDLAANIQDALLKHMDKQAKRNRGVRQAPFVVLIGAHMPSVLAEISFLSNPSDEQWLKKPENRQKIADGLYQGVAGYLHSTNSLTSNLAASDPPVAPAGNRQ